MQSVQVERPPYVRFEIRDVENRQRTLAEGGYRSDDVAFAIITPQGSKDQVERIATEWLDYLDEMVRVDRFNPEWARAFRSAYEAWLKDEEPPVVGVPLRSWPNITPSQYKQLRSLRLLTVEDVAAMNEETINRVGMGARALKQKAQDWLEMSKRGIPVEETTALRIMNNDLKTQVERQAQQLAALANALASAGIKIPGSATEAPEEPPTRLEIEVPPESAE